MKIQEIFGIATVKSTLPPSLCNLPLLVYGPIHSSRNRTLGTKAVRMLSLRSDTVRRRPDLAKMCWSCATKHNISPTSTRSLRSRLSLSKQTAPRALFSSHSRVHSAHCLPHDTHLPSSSNWIVHMSTLYIVQTCPPTIPQSNPSIN